MREPRVPILKLRKERPQDSGRFRTEIVIELYPAKQWSEKFKPSSPMRSQSRCFREVAGEMVSVVPLNSNAMDDYYRLMINGKWYSTNGYRLELYTEEKAYQLLREWK